MGIPSIVSFLVISVRRVCVWSYRKGGQRAIDELQRTITEIEAKYKAELGRQRKKFETDIREYEIQVETLNRSNAELGKNGKAASTRIKVRKSHLSVVKMPPTIDLEKLVFSGLPLGRPCVVCLLTLFHVPRYSSHR